MVNLDWLHSGGRQHQQEDVIDFRRIMDEGDILLVNLSSGRRISEDNASLLGALMVNDLFLKARGRPKGARPFYLYVDECSRFVSEEIGRILDEGRQFGLHLILAHQHLAQLKKAGDAVYNAVWTDARTKVVFGGLSPDDAKVMAETVYMDEVDFEEPKESLSKPVTTGYEIIQLRSRTETHGNSRTQSRSDL
jgi:type IV secretory pathway TraG/TraD family ATPase VirD4